jgi:hypothetical protein
VKLIRLNDGDRITGVAIVAADEDAETHPIAGEEGEGESETAEETA